MAKRTCICCGRSYEFCPACGGEKSPSWRRIYDTEECMKIGQIMIASRGDNPSISKAAAKMEMEKYPNALQKIINNDSNTAKKIKEILNTKNNVEKNVKEDIVPETEKVEEVVEKEVVSEKPEEKKVEEKKRGKISENKLLQK